MPQENTSVPARRTYCACCIFHSFAKKGSSTFDDATGSSSSQVEIVDICESRECNERYRNLISRQPEKRCSALRAETGPSCPFYQIAKRGDV